MSLRGARHRRTVARPSRSKLGAGGLVQTRFLAKLGTGSAIPMFWDRDCFARNDPMANVAVNGYESSKLKGPGGCLGMKKGDIRDASSNGFKEEIRTRI